MVVCPFSVRSCKDSAPRRSNHSHKKVSIFLIVVHVLCEAVIPALKSFFCFSFSLPLMFLSSIPVQSGGCSVPRPVAHEIGARFDRLFPWEYQIWAKCNKPQWSSNPRNSHLHPRHSALPVLLCNVNGWLLFTLIKSSRCVFTWSIPASMQAGLPFEDQQVRFPTMHLLTKQTM